MILADGGASAVTDTSGRFTLEGAPVGANILVFSGSRKARVTLPIVLREGSELDLTVEVDNGTAKVACEEEQPEGTPETPGMATTTNLCDPGDPDSDSPGNPTDGQQGDGQQGDGKPGDGPQGDGPNDNRDDGNRGGEGGGNAGGGGGGE